MINIGSIVGLLIWTPLFFCIFFVISLTNAVVFYCSKEETASFTLWDTSTDVDININDKMVELGHAVFCSTEDEIASLLQVGILSTANIQVQTAFYKYHSQQQVYMQTPTFDEQQTF